MWSWCFLISFHFLFLSGRVALQLPSSWTGMRRPSEIVICFFRNCVCWVFREFSRLSPRFQVILLFCVHYLTTASRFSMCSQLGVDVQTLFSFSSYLYTIPPSQRYSMFTEQCNAINKMTLSQCHGIWLPLHHGLLITKIVTEDSKVLSTKARCPCVFQFDVIGSGRKARVKKEKTVLDVFHPPYTNAKLTFFSWICSFFRPSEKSPSLDIDLFPSKTEAEDSVIVVSDNRFRWVKCVF